MDHTSAFMYITSQIYYIDSSVFGMLEHYYLHNNVRVYFRMNACFPLVIISRANRLTAEIGSKVQWHLQASFRDKSVHSSP